MGIENGVSLKQHKLPMESNQPESTSIFGLLRHLRRQPVVGDTVDGYLSYYSDGPQPVPASNGDYDAVTSADAAEAAAVARRRENAANVTKAYYDVSTKFYEYGWGQSFHFGVLGCGESREHSFAKHEYHLALKLGIKQTDSVLDVGCGIGGPARNIASLSGAKVVGINYNAYQLSRARLLTSKAELSHLCTFIEGDFHHMPYDDGHFDKAYAIEATCHSSELTKVYSEILRVLKPGGLFASYEWIVTDKYDSTNPHHKKLKADILEGDALPDLYTEAEVLAAARKVGFEVVEARDRTLDSPVPWYRVLQSSWSMSDFPSTPLGRWCVHTILTVLETCRLAPNGSVKVHRTLCKAADALCTAGIEDIFSPMYLVVLRKPQPDAA